MLACMLACLPAACRQAANMRLSILQIILEEFVNKLEVSLPPIHPVMRLAK
jgi:hypothetical protein